ncbi:amino acid permease [Saccharopolyspora hattusasensis]|uniref:APC family permease n=1 Tax=Saccharopolyspora hattusasensis TaxID=1128679 RepID=UPI003D9641D4
MLGAFTIVGFESAANLAEETKNPARVVPKAMAQAVVGLGVLGMLFLVAVTALAGDPVALAQSDTPVADVIARVLGSYVGKALLVLVVVSIFSCGLVISLSGARLVWAMARDKRFPAWQLLNKINGSTGTPMNASVFMFVVSQIVLALFARSTQALFSLFSAATLLPALIYAATVALYVAKRRSLPPSKGFELGRLEIPVLVLAVVSLAYELLIFRETSFAEPWLYVLVMFAIGALYLIYLLVRHGARASFSGMTLSTEAGHLVKAALDGIAAQVTELVDCAARDIGEPLSRLRVDGGLTRSRVLMQAVADLLQVQVDVYPSAHATALGAAGFARAAVDPGLPLDQAVVDWTPSTSFAPQLGADTAAAFRARWRAAVDTALTSDRKIQEES